MFFHAAFPSRLRRASCLALAAAAILRVAALAQAPRRRRSRPRRRRRRHVEPREHFARRVTSARPRDRRRQRRGADAVRPQRAEARRAGADEGGERARRRRRTSSKSRCSSGSSPSARCMQYAKETGIRVDDTKVERAILRIARGEQAHARGLPQGASSARAFRTRSIARTSATRSRSSGCASARSTAAST